MLWNFQGFFSYCRFFPKLHICWACTTSCVITLGCVTGSESFHVKWLWLWSLAGKMHNYDTLLDQSHGSLLLNNEILLTVWSGSVFFYSPLLRTWRLVFVIWPRHSSLMPLHIWTAVWIKPLSQACAHGWKERYSGLVRGIASNTCTVRGAGLH